MAQVLTIRKASVWPGLKRVFESPLVWGLLVATFVAGRDLATNGTTFFGTLGGTDDATRLIEVRRLLEGASWFDMTLPRMGAPDVLWSHWSRLVDLPLAGMIALFTPALGRDGAETATRLIWPSMTLIAMSYLAIRETQREAGTMGSVAAAVLIALGPLAVFQFSPGRIDHHNVQILGVAGGLILLPRACARPKLAPVVGVMIGLGLAVGYEALVLAACVMGLAGLFACFVPDLRKGFSLALLSCAATLLAAFVATTAPNHWLPAPCDALGINLVALVASGGVAAWALERFAPRAHFGVWLAGLAVGGALGLALGLMAEPACIAGPMAGVDPRVGPIWLDHIIEVQSIFQYARGLPAAGVTYAVVVGLGLLAGISGVRRERSPLALLQLAIFVAAAAYGCIYMRLVPYATWIMLPATAIWIARLPAVGSLSELSIRVIALIFLSQPSILMFTNLAIPAPAGGDQQGAVTAACRNRSDFRAFGRLKPGLVVGDVDLGPDIVAHSHHRVMAAPYHRIAKSIIAAHEILASAPSEALAKLRAAHVDYVALCAGKTDNAGTNPKRARPAEGIGGMLRRGGTVPYLEPVRIGDGTSKLMVWRVKPPAS